jgi:hypothetical protein
MMTSPLRRLYFARESVGTQVRGITPTPTLCKPRCVRPHQPVLTLILHPASPPSRAPALTAEERQADEPMTQADAPAQPMPDRSWCCGRGDLCDCVCQQAEDECSGPRFFITPCSALLCRTSFGAWSSWFSRSLCGTCVCVCVHTQLQDVVLGCVTKSCDDGQERYSRSS